MQTRQTIKSLLFAVAAFGAMMFQSASASTTYGFTNITNNGNVNVAGQLTMDVTAVGTTAALFKFYNNVGIGSSIMDIYFDDANPPLFNTAPGTFTFSASNSSLGVFFDNVANPGDLPGGNSIYPVFSANHSGDSEKTGQGQSQVSQVENGVNAANEYVGFLGTFASGTNFDGLIAALNNGSFRAGLHVQAIAGACPPGSLDGCSDSDSFVNVSAVPLPAAAWLFGSALFGFMMVSNRRKV